ncbi:hypothetical protein Q4561_14770 [Alteromonas sp. 1_MG-2023]|uniref:hypothetical protein n=1 Tax=Alteromonas sp. 1_MG-2023 TaxID=3062669 RepID=UPI0026E4718B|nr:hypothetical protein [Alteromonas sp. 1_MG-2023]MDO6568334.1 hypothetical protein [Alteromonas sp. 1_MG-2023]
MRDELKMRRRGYVVMLIMAISLVTKLSPGMAMPMQMQHSVVLDIASMEDEQNSASDCHSSSHSQPLAEHVSSMQKNAVDNNAVESNAVEKDAIQNNAADSCCGTQCQCPAGMCANIYALLNNEMPVTHVTSTSLITFVHPQAPHTIFSGQFRPPKFAFAG